MRLLAILAIVIALLAAVGAACDEDGDEPPGTPTPTGGSEDETEETDGAPPETETETPDGVEEGGEDTADDGVEVDEQAEDGEDPEGGADDGDEAGEPLEACPDPDHDTMCNDDDDDDDGDGFSDGAEVGVGSDPLDPDSVPENHAMNPGTCMDGLDNDGDGLTDASDPNCPAGPRGLSAALGVTPRGYDGPCPMTMEFSGIISVEVGRGPVSYRFVTSYGGEGPTMTLSFDEPGIQTVRLTSRPMATLMGWAVIQILAPEEHESNRAEFSVTCQ